jgi:DNA-binding MarR family transcriptional regulator
VERQTDKADRRAFIVRPTKLGVEAAERLTKTKQTIMTEILGNWQPTDKQELQRLLAQLVKDTEAFEQRTKQMVIQTKE